MTDESLLTGLTPANFAFDATPFSGGLAMRFAQPGVVKGIKFYAHTTLSGGTYIGGLHSMTTQDGGSDSAGTGTGTLIDQATFGTLTAGAWNQVLFSTPVTVNTTTIYVPTMYSSVGRYGSTTGLLTSDLVSGNITGIANGSTALSKVVWNGRYNYATGISYPNDRFGGEVYFVDVIYEAAGGTAFTRTVDDSAGISDAIFVAVGFARAQTDTAGLADSAVTAAALARFQTDIAGLADAATGAVAYARTADDPAGLTDTALSALAAERTVTDLAGLTDSATPALTGGGSFTRTADDLVGLTDSAAAASTFAGPDRHRGPQRRGDHSRLLRPLPDRYNRPDRRSHHPARRRRISHGRRPGRPHRLSRLLLHPDRRRRARPDRRRYAGHGRCPRRGRHHRADRRCHRRAGPSGHDHRPGRPDRHRNCATVRGHRSHPHGHRPGRPDLRPPGSADHSAAVHRPNRPPVHRHHSLAPVRSRLRGSYAPDHPGGRAP
jgi:hypothetical protein